MNDEKLDKIFEEAFKVEYRKEFKQELKDLLLKEYDKRKKGRFFFRISTVVAACIILAIVVFGAVKFDLMRLNIQDTSFVKTEMERVFQQQDTSTRQETEQNDNNSKNSNLFTKQETLQKSDNLGKSQTQSTEQKQTSNDDKRMSSDSKGTFVTSFSTKSESEKSSEVTKKSSSTINGNKNNTDKKVQNSSVSLQNAENSKIVKSDFESKTKQSIEKDSDSNSKNESSDTSVIVTKQSKEVEKEKQDMIVKVQEENVLESVYVLKEEELKIDKEHVLDILSTIVSSGVYEKVYFTPQNIVQADVYDGYLNFVVAKRDIQVSIYRFSEYKEQEEVLKSVYNKTDLILQKLGIKDYKISVFPKEEGYRAEVVFYFNGYRIFDVDSFIDYSNNADVIGGRIYLKNFSKFKSMKIIDVKTAVKEFEKRYNLKDVEPSDIDIVYRKTGELFIPVYIYIYENKIYWLEK